ncbi:hypothetical protein PAXRUDRAFT_40829, partial [Paxillus rubicundulus Ve08.2h10]
YMELMRSISEDQIRKWSDKELQALRLRGKHLDIYTTKSEKAPSMADIQLSLMSTPSAEHGHSGSISWLTAGISIEDAQNLVREAVCQLPTDATATQKADVMAKQLALQSKVQKHQDEADSSMDGLDILEHCTPLEPIDYIGFLPSHYYGIEPLDGEDQDQEDEYIEGEDIEEVVPPEDVCIWMP